VGIASGVNRARHANDAIDVIDVIARRENGEGRRVGSGRWSSGLVTAARAAGMTMP